MSDRPTAIRISGLSKVYTIGSSKEDSLKSTLGGVFNRVSKGTTFEALKDLNLEIKQGEVIGIIGKNGAGKSTLLKILSRITKPSSGKVEINGRIASLLEVGTGFHPELSGRENIYLNGTILGMTRKEVKEKFDEIVAFSGVEKFIDTPVKHYSSGMYVRLAFAVAAHLEPEILIIDEVLAVGDAEFQKKCLGKMKEVAGHGRTVIFVSHNMNAMLALCEKGLFLSEGKIVEYGNIDEVVSSYLTMFSNQESKIILNYLNKGVLSNDLVEILSCEFVSSYSSGDDHFNINKENEIRIIYKPKISGLKLNLSLSFYSENEDYIFASPSLSDSVWFNSEHPIQDYLAICKIPPKLLNESTYLISILIVQDAKEVILCADKVLKVNLFDDGSERGGYVGKWSGLIRPILEWNVSTIS